MNPDHFRPDQTLSPMRPLPIVLRCSDRLANRVRYTFDTLFQAAGVLLTYVAQAPSSGPWLLYARTKQSESSLASCMSIAHCPEGWDLFDGHSDVETAADVDNLPAVLPQTSPGFDDASDIRFDIIANAFYFLSSWSERAGQEGKVTRQLHANSVFARLGLPQDIVDLYLEGLMHRLRRLYIRSRVEPWPIDASYHSIVCPRPSSKLVVATNMSPRSPQHTKYQMMKRTWSLACAVSTCHARSYRSR